MAAGRITGNSPSPYLKLITDWASTADRARNRSAITLTHYLWHYSISVGARTVSVNCDGQTASFSASAINHPSNTAKYTLLGSQTFTVNHDSNGYKNCNISASYPFNGNYGGYNVGVIKIQSVIALDYINQASPIITSLTVTDIGQNSARIAVVFTAPYGASVDYYLDGTKQQNEYLSGLEAGRTYSVRVIVKGNNGKQTERTTSFTTHGEPLTDIYVSPSLTVDEGATASIGLILTPSNTTDKPLYSSTNTAIATASNGIVAGKAKGTATITAYKGAISDSCIVTVIRRVQRIEAPEILVVRENNTIALPFAIVPATASDTSVTITSSDPLTVSVQDNNIIGLQEGTVTITITSTDGGHEAIIEVEVQAEPVWQDLQPLDRLGYKDIERVFNNIDYLNNKLINQGYNVDNLEPIDTSGKHATPLKNILDIMNGVEANLTIINNAIDWDNPYYEDVPWEWDSEDKYNKVLRWVQSLNFDYAVVSGANPKSIYLKDINNDYITDINEERILVQGGMF